MQRLEVSGAVRLIYVFRRQRVKRMLSGLHCRSGSFGEHKKSYPCRESTNISSVVQVIF